MMHVHRRGGRRSGHGRPARAAQQAEELAGISLLAQVDMQAVNRMFLASGNLNSEAIVDFVKVPALPVPFHLLAPSLLSPQISAVSMLFS